jgi:hypothetical protein
MKVVKAPLFNLWSNPRMVTNADPEILERLKHLRLSSETIDRIRERAKVRAKGRMSRPLTLEKEVK